MLQLRAENEQLADKAADFRRKYEEVRRKYDDEKKEHVRWITAFLSIVT